MTPFEQEAFTALVASRAAKKAAEKRKEKGQEIAERVKEIRQDAFAARLRAAYRRQYEDSNGKDQRGENT